MRSLFTIHAGEYLVGQYIEDKFKDCRVWVPTKDVGIDLLVTDDECRNPVSLQVKFSKDYSTGSKYSYDTDFTATGWFNLNRDKILESPAEFWVFVLYDMSQKTPNFVIIKPKVLLEKIDNYRNESKKVNLYFWIKDEKCWEGRGLSKTDKWDILKGDFKDNERDFSNFLNKWESVLKKIIKTQ